MFRKFSDYINDALKVNALIIFRGKAIDKDTMVASLKEVGIINPEVISDCWDAWFTIDRDRVVHAVESDEDFDELIDAGYTCRTLTMDSGELYVMPTKDIPWLSNLDLFAMATGHKRLAQLAHEAGLEAETYTMLTTSANYWLNLLIRLEQPARAFSESLGPTYMCYKDISGEEIPEIEKLACDYYLGSFAECNNMPEGLVEEMFKLFEVFEDKVSK